MNCHYRYFKLLKIDLSEFYLNCPFDSNPNVWLRGRWTFLATDNDSLVENYTLKICLSEIRQLFFFIFWHNILNFFSHFLENKSNGCTILILNSRNSNEIWYNYHELIYSGRHEEYGRTQSAPNDRWWAHLHSSPGEYAIWAVTNNEKWDNRGRIKSNFKSQDIFHCATQRVVGMKIHQK
jgi:hypothetical protein